MGVVLGVPVISPVKNLASLVNSHWRVSVKLVTLEQRWLGLTIFHQLVKLTLLN